MSIFNELLINVLGGVLTAFILSLFIRRRSKVENHTHQITNTERTPQTKPSFFSDFIHVICAVIGGIAIAMFGGRFLFKSGILERGLPMRLILLIAGTTFVWWVIRLLKRR